MASRAERNALTTIAMAEALCPTLINIYRHRARNKTVMGLTDRLQRTTQEALKAWPAASKKDLVRIGTRVERFKTQGFGGNEGKEMSVYTSFCLAILDDLAEMVNGKKRATVEAVIVKAKSLHRYFDQKLNRVADYEEASRAVRVWRALEV